MDGEVTSTMLGADMQTGDWLAGIAFSHNEGAGGYRPEKGIGGDSGDVEASMNALYPYVRAYLHSDTSVWAMAGAGEGHIRLKPSTGKTEPHACCLSRNSVADFSVYF